MTNRVLDAIARRQHGLVTRAQVLGVLTERQLQRRLRDGRLVPVRPTVFRLAGAPEGWAQAVHAACLAAGPDAATSFETAAVLWPLVGFDRPDLIDLVVPAPRWVRLDGVRAHRSGLLLPGHLTVRDGIPVTSVARTIVDLSAVADPRTLERAVDDALRRGLLRLRDLRRCYEQLATRGRRRATVVRAILEARLPGYEPGDSDLERRILGWIASAGLPTPVLGHRVRSGGRSCRLDLSYPDRRILIEFDGWDTHRTRTAFDADRDRANALELDDWLQLRFTSRMTRSGVVATVEAALARRPAPGSPSRPPNPRTSRDVPPRRWGDRDLFAEEDERATG